MIDYLILGGGSAGCVLAARLSEDPDKQVCLIEAGRDISGQSMPPEIRARYPGRAYLDVSNIWQRLTALMGNRANATRRYEQARILGGGSAINALMTNRGAPADYDEWQALGAQGWSWETCLPYFRKLENDTDFAAPQDRALHGSDGPLRIRRTPAERLSPFVKGVMQVLGGRGLEHKADQNGAWEEGVFVGAIGVSEQGERIPTSVCYLTDEVRQRKNLTIRTQCVVDRVLIKAGRATGARIIGGDAVAESLQALEVIVCAGAIHSPAVLLRSGIGPAYDLVTQGITLVADRPGVGATSWSTRRLRCRRCSIAKGARRFPKNTMNKPLCGFLQGWRTRCRATCTAQSCRDQAGIRLATVWARCFLGQQIVFQGAFAPGLQ